MKFLLFCEGSTEQTVLPSFLKRWLDPQLSHQVGLKTVAFNGWRDLYKGVKKKARLRLKETDVIAVISLLDLYGPDFFPHDITSVDDRYSWGKQHIENLVDHEQFFQFFAVHEVEAWLLSDPSIFPSAIRASFPNKIDHPEAVNFTEPPAKLLNRLYVEKTRRNYKKVVNGMKLFGDLDPETAQDRCPYFSAMLNKMLLLAKEAGL